MTRNIAESVNAKLRSLAREADEDMVTVQTRYVLERLLWRFTQTPWADRIALKGALIFVAHFGDVHRPTSDIDVNGYGEGTAADILDLVREASAVEAPDGVVFLPETAVIRKDRDWSVVQGGKVALDARIGSSLIRVRVDAGFGNAVTPEAELADYPSMLPEMPNPRIRVYPLETMIAEKVDAMVRHGAETSRLRDFYDLWALSERREFDGAVLSLAIRRTFDQMGRLLPSAELDALSDDFIFLNEAAWERYRKGRGLRLEAPVLEEVILRLREFIEPTVAYARDEGAPEPGRWVPGEGWEAAPSPLP